MQVLILGAAGRIGSRAVASCLSRGHRVTALVRSPAKLSEAIRNDANVTVVQGDARDKAALSEAIKGRDAVIQAAVYGCISPWGDTSASEAVIRTLVEAANQEQSRRGKGGAKSPLRVWIVSGQVVMDLPSRPGKIEGDYIPIHPEHYKNYAHVKEHARDLDWSLVCPGRVVEGELAGPLVATVDHVGLWQLPGIWGNVPLIGTYLNIFYNWSKMAISYKGVGEFLADSLGPGGKMTGKRVCLLEDPTGRSA